MSTLIIMMRAKLFIIMRVKPIENIGDNSTPVDPFRAHAKTPALPLPLTPHHKKQQTTIGYQHPTMANSTAPVADLPAAPILDALPDTASPDPTVVVDPPFGPTADFYRPSKPTTSTTLFPYQQTINRPCRLLPCPT
jgi:hypothetical protein